MALPAPNLDDRRFQQLVDDAKRHVQERCKGWTDHNVSDPGVTLIETFAFMVDQLLYRLNRVPDRNYLEFLDLIGVRLFPPTAARARVTFWLSAALPERVTIPVGTEVATVRTEKDEAVAFTVVEDLDIVPCQLVHLASEIVEGEFRDHTSLLTGGDGFFCFDQVPKVGNTLYVGLSEPVPNCAVLLRFDCQVEGVGVDPDYPPWFWDAWDGERWVPCDLDSDTTGGLNRLGDVIVHVPPRHAKKLLGAHSAAWLRCRIIDTFLDQTGYSASPRINRAEAMTIGGTTETVHAAVIENEDLGIAEGVAGQTFQLKHGPVVMAPEPLVIEMGDGEATTGWEEWRQVTDFGTSDVQARHFVLNASTGTIELGPAVRLPDGSLRHYGAVPAKGARVRIPTYRIGGGSKGNVAARTITELKTGIPYITKVVNRAGASGGIDGEDIDNAKVRGPLLLRTRDRAVTAEDYEHLVREATPEVARVKCVPAEGKGTEGGVQIFVVPRVEDGEFGNLEFHQLVVDPAVLDCIRDYLEERRVIGTRVVIGPPYYDGIRIHVRLRGQPSVSADRLKREAVTALHRYFHPLKGGPKGGGWPFGRPVQVGDVYSVLHSLAGLEYVEDAVLYPVPDPRSPGTLGEATARVTVGPSNLVFSSKHVVKVDG